MKVRQFVLLAKLILSVGLVWYVASKFDLKDALAQLRNLTVGALVATLAIYYVQLLTAALRYREFLGVMGAKFSVRRSVDATLIGYFFSQTFISFVGGDAMRLLRTNKAGIQFGTAAKAIVLDRASGFAGQVLLILLVLPFTLPRISDVNMRLSLLGVVGAGVIGALAVLAASRLPAVARRVKIVNTIADVSGRVIRRIATWRGCAAFFGFSLLINFLNLALFYVIGQGLGVQLRFLDCLVLLPPVFLIAMLPISVAGWGVREGLVIVALGLAGVPPSSSLAISVCFGLGLIVISLPGGILWLFSKRSEPAPATHHAQN